VLHQAQDPHIQYQRSDNYVNSTTYWNMDSPPRLEMKIPGSPWPGGHSDSSV